MAEIIEIEATVGRMAKNAMSEIVARLVKVRGTPCLDVRVFALATNGDMVPTRAGICVSRDKASEFLALVNKLAAACGPQTAGDEEADGHEGQEGGN